MAKGKRKPKPDALAGTGLPPLFVPVEEARGLLGVGKRKMRKLMQGRLESFMLDGGRRIPYANVLIVIGDTDAQRKPPPFVDVVTAAALIRVSPSKLYDMMRQGRVKYFDVEGRRRIPYASLEALNPLAKGEPLIAPESDTDAPPAQTELFLPKRRGRRRKAAVMPDQPRTPELPDTFEEVPTLRDANGYLLRESIKRGMKPPLLVTCVAKSQGVVVMSWAESQPGLLVPTLVSEHSQGESFDPPFNFHIVDSAGVAAFADFDPARA